MSVKSKKRSKVARKARVDRPFDPAIEARARDIVAQYRIAIQADPDVGFMGNCIEMPLVFGDGKTPDACVRDTRAAMIAVVAYMLESGQVPPASMSENRRDQQLNVRLTLEEKLALEEAARQNGFRGVSDFVRARSLQGLH